MAEDDQVNADNFYKTKMKEFRSFSYSRLLRLCLLFTNFILSTDANNFRQGAA